MELSVNSTPPPLFSLSPSSPCNCSSTHVYIHPPKHKEEEENMMCESLFDNQRIFPVHLQLSLCTVTDASRCIRSLHTSLCLWRCYGVAVPPSRALPWMGHGFHARVLFSLLSCFAFISRLLQCTVSVTDVIIIIWCSAYAVLRLSRNCQNLFGETLVFVSCNFMRSWSRLLISGTRRRNGLKRTFQCSRYHDTGLSSCLLVS